MRRASEGEGFGDRGQQRLGQVPAGGGQELEALVERQRIGPVRREQWAGLDQLGRDLLRAAVPGAPPNLLPVAADGVDLAVVGDGPEGLGEPPHGMRVRRVALVEERVADHERFGQVGVQLGEPRPRDEALVDDGPARRRRDRELGECPAGGARCALHAPARNHEASFECVVADRRAGLAHRTRHDRLAECGSRCCGRAPEGGGIGRNGRASGGRACPPRRRSVRSARGPRPRPNGRAAGRRRRRPGGRPPNRRRAAASRTGRAAGRPRRRHSTRRRHRTRRDGRAPRDRPAPAAGPGHVTGHPRPPRTRRRTHRARSARRTAGALRGGRSRWSCRRSPR